MLATDRASPLFDDAQIELLRQAIGTDDLNEMLLEFPPAAAKSLAALELALASDNFDHARRAAHIIKGCAATFGAARVAEAARQIELELPSIEAMRQHLPVLVEALNLTAAALSGLACASSGR